MIVWLFILCFILFWPIVVGRNLPHGAAGGEAMTRGPPPPPSALPLEERGLAAGAENSTTTTALAPRSSSLSTPTSPDHPRPRVAAALASPHHPRSARGLDLCEAMAGMSTSCPTNTTIATPHHNSREASHLHGKSQD